MRRKARIEYVLSLVYRKISEDSLRASSLDWFFEGSEW